MAFPKDKSQHAISSKRQLDDADDRDLDEFRKPKTVVRKYPPPKIRIGVQAVRDFPPGCGILQDPMESKAERKPLKRLGIDNTTSHVNDKMVDSQTLENIKLNSYKPKELGFNKPSFGPRSLGKVKFWDPKEQVVRDFPPLCGIKESKLLKNLDNVDSKIGFKKPSFATRPPGKVKYWDPTCSNDDNAQNSIATKTLESQKDQIRREKIHEAMILFDTVYTKIYQDNGSKQMGEKIAPCGVSREAYRMVKQKLKLMDAEKTLGQIPGILPGDKFKFRSQLQLVGLHCQHLRGIDYVKINGKNLAISIVDSHRYLNKSESCDVLSYCGEGGDSVGVFGPSQQVASDDQKLERGNLALKNSMKEKNPIRVIRKLVGARRKNDYVYVYDGLYTVFMFQLHKMPGQTQVQKRVNVIPNHSTFQMVV